MNEYHFGNQLYNYVIEQTEFLMQIKDAEQLKVNNEEIRRPSYLWLSSKKRKVIKLTEYQICGIYNLISKLTDDEITSGLLKIQDDVMKTKNLTSNQVYCIVISTFNLKQITSMLVNSTLIRRNNFFSSFRRNRIYPIMRSLFFKNQIC